MNENLYKGGLKNLAVGLRAAAQKLRGRDGRLTKRPTQGLASSLLIQAGWRSYTGPINKLVDQALLDALEELQPQIKSQLNKKRLKNNALAYLTTVFEQLRVGIEAPLLTLLQTMAEAPMSDVAVGESLRSITKTTKNRALSAVNTAIAGIQTDLQIQSAKILEQKGEQVYYLYTGPQDKITRDFCSHLVGKAIRAEDAAELRNGQGIPFLRFRGGYNCRHTITTVTEMFVMARRTPIATKADIAAANKAGRRR